LSLEKHSRQNEAVLNDRLNELKSLALNIVETEPRNSDALNSLGLICMQSKFYDEAIGFFEQAHNIEPERVEYTDNLAKAFEFCAKKMCELGHFPSAIEILERGLVIFPDNLALTLKMSFALGLAKRNKEALAVSNAVIKSDPESAEAHDMRGLALLGLSQIDLAINSFRRALDCNNEYAGVCVNMGSAFRIKGDLNEAALWFEKAINLDKNNKQAHNNLGILFFERNDLKRAEKSIRNALAIDPDFAEAHFNLSRVLLMAEDFSEGWKQYGWRWSCPEFPSTWREYPQPIWKGEDLNNKNILVWSEQGIGDEIMFANTLADLNQNSAGVIIECSERLVPVFKRSFGGITVVARQEPPHPLIENFNAKVQIPLGSICNYYRTTIDSFPSKSQGYLKSDPSITEKIKSRYDALGEGIKVGISWRSGNPIVGHERSIPIEMWHEILSLPGCHFINLQYGNIEDDLKDIFNSYGISVHQDKLVDPMKSAEEWFAQIAALDHVISVDNSTIQVSGSLGVPTWTLLSAAPEWRFGLDRSDHLWHPSVRVFRQQQKGKWGPLMKKVASEFAYFIEN